MMLLLVLLLLLLLPLPLPVAPPTDWLRPGDDISIDGTEAEPKSLPPSAWTGGPGDGSCGSVSCRACCHCCQLTDGQASGEVFVKEAQKMPSSAAAAVT